MKERPDIHSESFEQTRSTTPPDGRSIKQIIQDIVNNITDIIRSEVLLAKAEVRQDLTKFAKAGAFIAMAGLFILYATGFVLLSAVYALEQALPSWLAAVLVGVSVGVAAAILYVIGRKKLRQASLRPKETIQTLEDNVTWLKRQRK
jgi:hypothetical protein